MRSKLVGSQFTQAEAEGINEGDICIISHETSNEYDENALAVHFNGEKLGFIGKGTDLYELDRSNFPLEGKVIDFLRSVDGDNFTKHEEGVIVSLTLETKDFVELISKNDVNSFNEKGVVINFNEKTHTYTHDNNILTGATTFIKKYVKPFDDFMVGRCAKSWELDRKTIEDAWELGRDLASSFGTGIHKALEFEDLYRKYHKKSGDRCFTIKHPVISKIVSDFFTFYDNLGFSGEVTPEALISDVENGICALADRVLVTSWEKKTCRLQDYKVNHNFNTSGKVSFVNMPNGLRLPSTKLSKLALQLKVQSTMLEKSGWTVEACDGFVYEDEWKHYRVDLLEGFDIIRGTYK